MDLAAQNLANAETTRTPEGGPYRRRVAELGGVAIGEQGVGGLASGLGASSDPFPSAHLLASSSAVIGGVEIRGVREDASEGPMVYDPSHPDADARGYVRMPNVNMTDELLNLSDAGGAFNANATVFQAVRSMLQKALSI